MNGFEHAFASALRREPLPTGEPGPWSVYRNTYVRACVDALEANYPALVRLLGASWFREMAVLYARDHPPRQACLLFYGDAHLGPWIRAQAERCAPERDWTYLEGVTHLDSQWRHSHGAADAPALDATLLQQLSPDALATLVLKPHPAACWAWFDSAPVFTLWSRNREVSVGTAGDLVWCAEGALLTRPGAEVCWQPLSRAGCLLMDACAQGQSLLEAADATLAQAPHADLAELIRQLVLSGAFTLHEP